MKTKLEDAKIELNHLLSKSIRYFKETNRNASEDILLILRYLKYQVVHGKNDKKSIEDYYF